jgi:hypothetical protein
MLETPRSWFTYAIDQTAQVHRRPKVLAIRHLKSLLDVYLNHSILSDRDK